MRVAHAVARERWIETDHQSGTIQLAPDLAVDSQSPTGFGFDASTRWVGSAADPRRDDPSRLWAFICERRAIEPDAAARVRLELEDSRFNLGLCLLAEPHRSDLPVADARRDDPEHRTLMGHPWHPMTKTRLGLGLAEHVRYAPELLAQARVQAVDVAQALATSSNNFAERIEPLLGRAPAGFVRIPVHPAQRARLPRLLAEHWGRDVRAADGAYTAARSLLSLRTVTASGLHLKLALDAHTTSARRLVSTMSVQNGPQVSALLRTIAAEDPTVAQLDLAFEDDAAGLRFEALGKRAHQLGCILRDARHFEGSGGRAWVCAGLDAAPVGDDVPKPIEAMCASRSGTAQERAASVWRAYVERLFVPCARLLFNYGVALEPHLQNTLVRLRDDGDLQFVVRDLGGIRVHRGRLRDAGLGFEAAPGSFIVTDDIDEVRNKFAHTMLHAHAHSVIGWLHHRLGLSPKTAWQLLAQRLRATAATSRTSAAADLAHFMTPRGAAKCLFVMRIVDQSSDYVFTDVDNPLASTSA